MVDFSKFLSKKVDEVKRPVNFPTGSYSGMVMNHEFGKSSQKGTPYCRFYIKLLGPLEDVDPELFENAGGIEALNKRKPLKMDFYLTDDAQYRLGEFLTFGLELSTTGRPFDEVIPESTNCEVGVHLTLDPSESRKGEFYMNINDYVRVGDEEDDDD